MARRRARILATAALIALGWRGGTAQQTPAVEVFRTAEPCLACHSGTTIISRDSVSLGGEWRASMMANAARDPFWQAAVRREGTGGSRTCVPTTLLKQTDSCRITTRWPIHRLSGWPALK
jgi:hypothetical protein